MSSRTLIAGRLGAISRRVARNRVSYLALNVALDGGAEARVYTFNQRLAREIERLEAGSPVAICGRRWTPRDGRGGGVVADGILTAFGPVMRDRKPVPAADEHEDELPLLAGAKKEAQR
jgi:hypothetical protein